VSLKFGICRQFNIPKLFLFFNKNLSINLAGLLPIVGAIVEHFLQIQTAKGHPAKTGKHKCPKIIISY
jgi:hypothetical protein